MDNLILTANKRLSIHLRQEYDQMQLHKKTWLSLSIMPIQTWINQITEPLTSKLILSPEQELALWQTIIANSSHGALLFKSYATAKIAMQAWQLLKQWQLPLEVLTKDGNLDTQIFYQWACEFKKICEQQNWQEQAENINFLIDYIQKYPSNSFPDQIFLAGFQEYTPQMKNLFAALKSKTTLHLLSQEEAQALFSPENSSSLPEINGKKQSPSTHTKQLAKLELTHLESEIKAMALWAYTISMREPQARIACVVPKLTQQRDYIERIFAETFHFAKSFNISAGYPLTQLAIIRQVFHILYLTQNDISTQLINQIILSPFIKGSEEEMCARAQFSAKLLDFGESTWSLRAIIALAREMKSIPLLVEGLSQLQTLFKTTELRDSPKAWAKYFTQQLNMLGWPGQRTLSTEEYQSVQRFEQLLSEFSSLNLIFSDLDRKDAIFHFQNLAQQTIFQPETPKASIQILGALELFGLKFDYLWIMSVDDEHFPPQPKPHPFIPIIIQRQYHMPHVNAERELEFSLQLIQCYQGSSQNILLSYSKQDGDRILNPSSLINHIPIITLAELQLSEINPLRHKIYESAQLENFEDRKAPKINANENIRGGTYIFKAQAACPFRAFAQIRLSAQGLSNPSLGLNAMERGSLLHEALAIIWQQIKTQNELCQLSDQALEKIVLNAINDSLTHLIKTRPATLKKRFIEIEQKRLMDLIIRWLNIEKMRPSFQVIGQEQNYKVKINTLEVQMQIDRIDKLEDGSYIIIDYKTGYPNIKDWFGERPNEPQLPLYCVSNPQDIKSITFAQIRVDGMHFKGISAYSTDIAGVQVIDHFSDEDIPNSWQALQKYWQTIFVKLAEDFSEGHAEVNPKDEQACQYCDLQILCRINEA